MEDLKRIFSHLGPYRRDMILGALLLIIETGFELVIPVLMADIIDVGVANHDVPLYYPARASLWGAAQCSP